MAYYNIPFPHRQPSASAHLNLTLISLEDWVMVTIDGLDTVKYLQGQVTTDIAALTSDKHVMCGHCDANGKMWSNLRLFRIEGRGFAYLERRSVLESQLMAIKKYAVFSKVTIAIDNKAVLLGIVGPQARIALASIFAVLPHDKQQVVQEGDTTLLQLNAPVERFLLVTTDFVAEQLLSTLHGYVELNDSQQWLALDIESGYPIIDRANSLQMTPQATNLQAFHGISFNKGCYVGQEIVARAYFRGANKRALYWLEGSARRIPLVAEDLELQLGNQWRRTGRVLAAIILDDGTLWIQAVMNKNLDTSSKLRVRADISSQLRIKQLPYILIP